MARNKVIISIILILICSIFIIGIYHYKNLVITSFKLNGYESIDTPHFKIIYLPQNKKDILQIADAAEKTYEIVGKDFDFYPKDKTPIIVYKDNATLQKAFHWSQDESTQGVYYNGIIYIQTPSAWIDPKDNDTKDIFFAKGPMVHEYTHLVVDRKTSGNYSRWFTEGVAQLEEERVTGYTLEEDFDIDDDTKYSIEEILHNFDQLEDVPKAYIQALDMTKALTRKNTDKISEIFPLLKTGKSIDEIYLQEVVSIN